MTPSQYSVSRVTFTDWFVHSEPTLSQNLHHDPPLRQSHLIGFLAPQCSLFTVSTIGSIQRDSTLSACILIVWLNPIYGSHFYRVSVDL